MLDNQFEEEKRVFDNIASIKGEIESLKNVAIQAQREGDFNKSAEIEYGKIPAKNK